MCVRSEFCDKVTDKDEFVGRFKVVSRLPQYLRVESVCAQSGVGAYILDDCNVHRSCRACTMNTSVSHD